MANYETYSEEQREEVRARLQSFQDEQKAINDQIHILKGRYSNQIYQIRESIIKFLDIETGMLGERIRTLFREQCIRIISILTILGMTLGALIKAQEVLARPLLHHKVSLQVIKRVEPENG